MNNQKAENPYLGKVLDAYHLSVKRWGRDVLIAAFVIVTAWIMIVLPYLRWSEEEQRYTKVLEPEQQQLENIETFVKKVLAVENEFNQEKEAITSHAKDLVAHLVSRVKGFVGLVKSAREGRNAGLGDRLPDTELSQPTRPRADQITIRRDRPPPDPDPKEILEIVYDLSKEEVATITSAEASQQETPESKKASDIAEMLFQNEIDSVYKDLNVRVETGFAKLQTRVGNRLKKLASEAERFDANLPDTNDIILRFDKIDQPKGTELFRTVDGKRETLENEANKIITHIESAQTPFKKARLALVTSAEALKKSVEHLENQREALQDSIGELQDYIDNAKEQLDPFKTPFSLP